MNFFELAQAMTPFCVLILFYFYYRLNKLEKLLLISLSKIRKQQLQELEEKKLMIGTIEALEVRVSSLEQTFGIRAKIEGEEGQAEEAHQKGEIQE